MRHVGTTTAILLTALFVGVSVQAQSKVVAKNAGKLCKSVKSIKELPRDWGQKGVDKTYDAIIDAGEETAPCLIDQITDVTVMKDPRCPTISTATTVGDISYFLLVDILKLEFTQLLPSEVVASFKTRGVYAYHEYIDKDGSREELQLRLRDWWKQRKKN